MAKDDLKARVTAALEKVVNPRVGQDIVTAGMVKEIAAGADGKVQIAFELGREDPASLVREARLAAQAVSGVTGVKMQITGGAQQQAQTTPKPVPPPTARALPHLGKVVAVSSGKGGVGKSTVAVNLAAAPAAGAWA